MTLKMIFLNHTPLPVPIFTHNTILLADQPIFKVSRMSTLAERGVPVPSIGSILAGLLFGAGWYVWIDGCAWASHVHGYQVNGVYWVRAGPTGYERSNRELPVQGRLAIPFAPHLSPPASLPCTPLNVPWSSGAGAASDIVTRDGQHP
jgi:hypothetical protein